MVVIGWAHDDFNCDILIDICGFNRNIVSTFGVSITADILIDDVDVDQYDALAIPGGFEEYGFYKEPSNNVHKGTKFHCFKCI